MLAAAIEGFTITGGVADQGGGVRADRTYHLLKDCVLVGNQATTAGGGLYVEYGAPFFNGLTLQANTDPNNPASVNAVVKRSNINLRGNFTLAAGRLETQTCWFDGPGSIVLDASTDPNVVLHVTGSGGLVPLTVVRTSILGTGDIRIDAGQQLTLAQGALVDLSGRDPNDPSGPCADPNASADWGTITVDGTLLVRDSTVRNTNVQVNMGDVGDGTVIYNNEINLFQNPPGWGGEFFVEGTSTIGCNTIRSDGDRYLDLDPDPSIPPGQRPAIGSVAMGNPNRFYVTIRQGMNLTQGELLELRSQDFDPNLGGGLSGAHELASSPGYDDTWAFELLEVLGDPSTGGAKVNLTNRPGFVFQDPNIPIPEALYVKELKLYPEAVLNTGLQRLYYQSPGGRKRSALDA